MAFVLLLIFLKVGARNKVSGVGGGWLGEGISQGYGPPGIDA